MVKIHPLLVLHNRPYVLTSLSYNSHLAIVTCNQSYTLDCWSRFFAFNIGLDAYIEKVWFIQPVRLGIFTPKIYNIVHWRYLLHMSACYNSVHTNDVASLATPARPISMPFLLIPVKSKKQKKGPPKNSRANQKLP